jgi:hypothetical protein
MPTSSPSKTMFVDIAEYLLFGAADWNVNFGLRDWDDRGIQPEWDRAIDGSELTLKNKVSGKTGRKLISVVVAETQQSR